MIFWAIAQYSIYCIAASPKKCVSEWVCEEKVLDVWSGRFTAVLIASVWLLVTLIVLQYFPNTLELFTHQDSVHKRVKKIHMEVGQQYELPLAAIWPTRPIGTLGIPLLSILNFCRWLMNHKGALERFLDKENSNQTFVITSGYRVSLNSDLLKMCKKSPVLAKWSVLWIDDFSFHRTPTHRVIPQYHWCRGGGKGLESSIHCYRKVSVIAGVDAASHVIGQPKQYTCTRCQNKFREVADLHSHLVVCGMSGPAPSVQLNIGTAPSLVHSVTAGLHQGRV